MRGMALVNLGWAVVCPYRADFSDDDEVQKLVENWPNICFCNRISKVADVASSVFIGGVGDGNVAEHHYDLGAAADVVPSVLIGVVGDGIVTEHQYDLDAAANARNTSFPVALVGESEVDYSRLRGRLLFAFFVFPNILFVFWIVKLLLFTITRVQACEFHC